MVIKSTEKLRKQARDKRRRADILWMDAPKIRVDRFKRPYLNKVKKLYEEADRLDKEAKGLQEKA